MLPLPLSIRSFNLFICLNLFHFPFLSLPAGLSLPSPGTAGLVQVWGPPRPAAPVPGTGGKLGSRLWKFQCESFHGKGELISSLNTALSLASKIRESPLLELFQSKRTSDVSSLFLFSHRPLHFKALIVSSFKVACVTFQYILLLIIAALPCHSGT